MRGRSVAADALKLPHLLELLLLILDDRSRLLDDDATLLDNLERRLHLLNNDRGSATHNGTVNGDASPAADPDREVPLNGLATPPEETSKQPTGVGVGGHGQGEGGEDEAGGDEALHWDISS